MSSGFSRVREERESATSSELNVRAEPENVVIDAKQKNRCRGYNDRQKCPNWSVKTQRKAETGQTRNSTLIGKAKNIAMPPKRGILMEVTLLNWRAHLRTAHDEVANEP